MESGQAQIKCIFELCVRDKYPENVGTKIFITDGTMVGVLVFLLSEQKRARRKKLEMRSSGFCGYDWMIRSIIECGCILTDSARIKNNRKEAK